MRFRTIGAALAVPAALAGVLLTTTGASAATTAQAKVPGTVYATTHEGGVDDTFSPPGAWTGPTDPTGNGPIWAYDDVERQLTAVPGATPGTWQVTLHTVGTYSAFANPITGQYPVQPFSGRIDSTSYWTVTSLTPPSKANLPAQTPVSFRSQNVVAEFFGSTDGTVQPGMSVQGALPGSIWDYYGVPGANSNGVPGLMEQTA
jgi:hypothetical protein